MAAMTLGSVATRYASSNTTALRSSRRAVRRARAVAPRAVISSSKPDALYTAGDRAGKQISATGASLKDWAPDSWQAREALQQPNYESKETLNAALDEIANRPPLVFAGEARNLQAQLANAAAGNAFVLFGGDCAESFAEFRADNVRDTYRVLLQMSVVLMYGAGIPVVKLGRMAGQFAKPRSEDLETINGVTLPSYRGDNINGCDFTEAARRPDPQRLLRAYDQSCSTLNLLRAFSQGGYASMQRVSKWNLDFMEDSERGAEYRKLASNVDAAITCALPYHSTPEFVKLVQLSNLEGSQFYFLKHVKEKGAAPPRDQLVVRCSHDGAFLSFVCQAAAASASTKVRAFAHRCHVARIRVLWRGTRCA